MVPEQQSGQSSGHSLNVGEASYEESLLRVTRIGAVTGAIFIVFFISLDWARAFPAVIILIDVGALVIDLLGFVLADRFHIHKPAAHLVTLATYISLVGASLYMGGIEAPTMVWLAFIPIVATIMAGTKDGIVWGVISLASIVGIYVLNKSLGIDLTLVPPQSVSRMIDLLAITLGAGTATWLNEKAKAQALGQLESAQSTLKHLATLDPLTSVFNRRYFFSRAQMELDRANGRKSRTSVILFDIDHFKKVNDAYGHDIGDQILIGLVDICRQNLRESDTLARLGGEEFVILLPETGLPEARHIAERLRATLERTPIVSDAGALMMTVSVGVMSQAASELITVHTLVRGADQAMYLAKRAGGNQVATWQGQRLTPR